MAKRGKGGKENKKQPANRNRITAAFHKARSALPGSPNFSEDITPNIMAAKKEVTKPETPQNKILAAALSYLRHGNPVPPDIRSELTAEDRRLINNKLKEERRSFAVFFPGMSAPFMVCKQ